MTGENIEPARKPNDQRHMIIDADWPPNEQGRNGVLTDPSALQFRSGMSHGTLGRLAGSLPDIRDPTDPV